MEIYIRKTLFLSTLIFLLFSITGRSQEVRFEKEEPFYPYLDNSEKSFIEWGNLTVPENWNVPEGRKVEIAVSILKNTENKGNQETIVFIQGGPGVSGVSSIWSWLNHPLRKTHDIVLFDVRGTGFSTPRLCPDLGQDIFKILAKNQDESKDNTDKINAVMACKEKLIKEGVDVSQYNSDVVSKDLHALLGVLKIKKAVIYGVSYGTYIAQVYANNYPEDVSSLVLDSSISNIGTYYENNTVNYMESLSKVFTICKENSNLNKKFPDLEKKYYEVIEDLTTNPLKVDVETSILEEGSFTFNSEDFKVSIHQALYNKQLIELIPLIIYQFKDRNKEVITNLVPAFSSLLSLDYGVYFCFTCDEVIPENLYDEYKVNSNAYEKLSGGISFYNSDFLVCDKWNRQENISKDNSILTTDSLRVLDRPVLIISGEFDPITPSSNGKKLKGNYKYGKHILGKTYGHTPSFTYSGNNEVVSFLKSPKSYNSKKAFEDVIPLKIADNIYLNSGISKLGNLLSQMDYVFFAPLVIAFLVMIIFIFLIPYNFIKGNYKILQEKIINILIWISSVFGLYTFIRLILAIIATSEINFFILAFGLPSEYNYILQSILVFAVFVAVVFAFYLIVFRKIKDRTIVFSSIFSNALLLVYYLYLNIL